MVGLMCLDVEILEWLGWLGQGGTLAERKSIVGRGVLSWPRVVYTMETWVYLIYRLGGFHHFVLDVISLYLLPKF